MASEYTIRKDTDQTVTETVAATNITGATITWALLQPETPFGGDLDDLPDSDWAAFKKTVGDGITITDGANGVFTVTLDPADTEELEPAAGYWVLPRITLVSGDVVPTLAYPVTVGARET